MDLLEILSYPRFHGSEGEARFISQLLSFLDEHDGNIRIDQELNIWYETGPPEDYPFLFVAHIDTCHKVDDGTVETKFQDGYLHLVNKEVGCLGADDGVGLFVNMLMIKRKVKGTFLFTRGEERGLIGAGYISKHTPNRLKPFKLCVEVDRAGKTEIVVEQCSGKCASNEFANALIKALDMGHELCYTGVYTDNAEFNEIIPECVNIAAGYERQHGPKERLDYQYAQDLAMKLSNLDWASLPIVRDPSDTEYSDFSWYGSCDRSYDTNGTYIRYNGEDAFTKYGAYFDENEIANDSKAMSFTESKAFVEEFDNMVAYYLYYYGISPSEIYEAWVNGERTF